MVGKKSRCISQTRTVRGFANMVLKICVVLWFVVVRTWLVVYSWPFIYFICFASNLLWNNAWLQPFRYRSWSWGHSWINKIFESEKPVISSNPIWFLRAIVSQSGHSVSPKRLHSACILTNDFFNVTCCVYLTLTCYPNLNLTPNTPGTDGSSDPYNGWRGGCYHPTEG